MGLSRRDVVQSLNVALGRTPVLAEIRMGRRLIEARVHTLNAVNGIKAYKEDCEVQVEALEEGWSLQSIINVQLGVRIS